MRKRSLILGLLWLSASLSAGVRVEDGKVTFTLKGVQAESVHLAGEFNGWSLSATPMTYRNGVWTVTLELPPGRYQYKFVINGQEWMEDPENPEKVPDPYGGFNSVVVVPGKPGEKGEEKEEIPAHLPVWTPEGVRFLFYAPQANRVTLAGTFNNWDPNALPMKKRPDGWWEATVKLTPGTYQYKFVINGTTWKEDPRCPAKTDDGFGGFNSLFILHPKGGISWPGFGEAQEAAPPAEKAPGKVKTVEYTKGGVVFRFYAPDAQSVHLAGTFNNWAPNALPMKKRPDGWWEATVKLAPGTYQYKFVINGTTWKEDPHNPAKVDDGFGGYNSVFTLTEKGEILFEGGGAPTGALFSEPVAPTLQPVGNPVYLALVWHQHQPRYFQDPETGEFEAPWVRLHCIKDYYDMVAILERYPEIRFTVNLTPVLIRQIQEILARWEQGLPPDKYARLTLKDAAELTDEEKAFLLEHFFSAKWETMIDIWPRYRELRMKRVMNPDGSVNISASLAAYTEQDFRDLQAWFNLAWFDPDFQEGEVLLPSGESVSVRDLIQKGEGFTEEDKRRILDIQMKIVAAVLPIHRKLQEEGRIEVITTPYYHPILPLIYDTDLMALAMPTAPRPPRFHRPEDARWHVQAAAHLYRELFGQAPVGMWPAEGAVAHPVVPIIASEGFRWFASDVGVLSRSLGGGLLKDRDRYRAYRVIAGTDTLFGIFRDTDLSDRIGFRYSKMEPVQAANDFLLALYRIHQRFGGDSEAVLVPVILDGENAWEWYPRDGKAFLASLYSQLQEAQEKGWLRTVRVRDFLEAHPPIHTIRRLWAGSWINADFSTWIGEPEENLAWEYLKQVRDDLDRLTRSGAYPPEALQDAFDHMHAAEGSDWFWWFGADQNSVDDRVWDRWFRKTLKGVYQALGETPPAFLDQPIIGALAAGGGGVMQPGRKLPEEARLLARYEDPEGDDYGPGNYKRPTDPAFSTKGLWDLLEYAVYDAGDRWVFRFTFGALPNPWGAPLGFSHPIVNLYLDFRKGGKATSLEGPNVEMDPAHPWDVVLKIAGWPEYGTLWIPAEGPPQPGAVEVWADPAEKAVYAAVSKELLPNPEGFHYVLVGSQDGYGPDNWRPVENHPGQWVFGGARWDTAPRVIDMLAPSYNGKTQEEMLGSYTPERKAVVYPIRFPPVP